jgi:hypothetical protein
VKETPVKQVRKRLTYANVMSSLAVFLVLGGATAIAAKKIGSHQLKSNSVTTAKIKKNAVTTAKIKNKAVTNAKLADGAVNFAKIAAGTSLIASASGSILATEGAAGTFVTIPLSGTTTATPQAGVVDQLNIEARGSLGRTGEKECSPTVIPYVNGNAFELAEGFLTVRNFKPTTEEPTGSRPATSETGPIGLGAPGVAQSISVKLAGDADCTANSTVSVFIAITQLK